MARLYVFELEGYATDRTDGRLLPGLTAQILDRAYCHRSVWARRTERQGGRIPPIVLRAEAAARCAELNAEDAA